MWSSHESKKGILKMTNKKGKLAIALLFFSAFAFGIASFLIAETPATAQPEQQTPIIYYSIVPTLMMANLVSTAQVTTESMPMGFAPMGIISIYRLSAGD